MENTRSNSNSLSLPTRRWQRTLRNIRTQRQYFHHYLLPRLHTPSSRGGAISIPLFQICLEDTIRRLIREELSLNYFNLPPRSVVSTLFSILQQYNPIQWRINWAAATSKHPSSYHLDFINNVKSPTFTTDLVTDDNGGPIKVMMYDTYSQSIVSSHCSLSSAKVSLMVLNAEFWENNEENWTRSELNQRILRERDGKEPILTGHDLTVRLENGLGTFKNITFKDNSSWTKCGFRLGVIVHGEGEEGYLNGVRVREGLRKPFLVKDRRGKASQKPDRLELKHNVRSIKNIGKDRASLLENNNIKTVRDFLWLYYHNQAELRKILGIKSDSDKGWINMVRHAKECDNEFFSSYNGINSTYQPQQVPFENQSNISNPNFNQIACVINNFPVEEIMAWMFTLEVQALVYPMYSNRSLYINGGPHVDGLGSSEPNPYERNIIGVNEHISTSSGEAVVEMQHPLFPETNLTAIAGGNVVNVNSMENTIDNGLVPLEISDNLVRMEDLLANTDSMSDNIWQSPARSDSFDTDLCEALVQSFIASMSNSAYAGPPTAHRNKKVKALLRSVAFLAIPRKRARVAPPVNQTAVPAL